MKFTIDVADIARAAPQGTVTATRYVPIEMVDLNDRAYPVGSDEIERQVIDCEQAQMDAVKAIEFLLSKGAHGLVAQVLEEYQVFIYESRAYRLLGEGAAE